MTKPKATTETPDLSSLSRQVERITLDGRYEGLWFDADLEPTWEEIRNLGSEKLDTTVEVLSSLIVDWNFVDKQRVPIPPPAESGFNKVTLPLLRATLLAYVAFLTKGTELPKG